MVMELLEGEDLATRLSRGPMGVAEPVDCLLEICEALAEAHATGIVHRDLKPANVFLAQQTAGAVRVKLLDFGLSKILDAPELTKTSTVMGSPLYMSPEQMVSAKRADARTDVWALGCILFECLSGRPPFLAHTFAELCSFVLKHPPASLRTHAAHAPQELELVIERALVKAPEGRYQDLGELADALAPFAGERGQRSIQAIRRMLGRTEIVSVEQQATELALPEQPLDLTAAPLAHTIPGAARRRGVLVYLGAASVALAGIVGFALASSREPDPSEVQIAKRANAAPVIDVGAEAARRVSPPSASASATIDREPKRAPVARPVRRLPASRPGDSLFNGPNG
jgi:serine/threonine-protein kinase